VNEEGGKSRPKIAFIWYLKFGLVLHGNLKILNLPAKQMYPWKFTS